MTRWDHLRAVVITLALVAHGIYALPLPRAITPRGVQEDWRQRDIALWQGWMADFGLEVSKETFEEQLIFWTELSGGLHKTLKAPFKPLFKLTSSNQAWALFAAATTKPETLVVDISENGRDYRTIARRLDPEATWNDPIIRYRRIRGVWDGQKKRTRRTYRHLAQWLADRAFEDFPEADHVNVYLEQRRSVYPWEEPDLTITVRHKRQHRRPRP